jgi:hypothetical protein
MKLNKILPSINLDDLLTQLSLKLRSSVIETKDSAPQGFVEFEDGTRYAIQTYYGEHVDEFKNITRACTEFTEKLISRLDKDAVLYIRKDINIHHSCLESGKQYWTPYCRIRQPGHEIESIDTSDIKRLIK